MATEVIVRESRRKYRWPEVQLNLWIFIVLAGAATVLGINAWFISVQNQLRIGVPWYGWRPNPSRTIAPRPQLTRFQDLHLCCCHWRPHHPLPHHPPHTRLPTNADTGRHLTRLLHPVCLMGHHTHRNRHPTLRKWKREQQLQQLCHGPRVSWCVDRNPSVVDAKQYLLMLEGLVRLVHYSGRAVSLDDGLVVASAEL